jgi:hypothetical protein
LSEQLGGSAVGEHLALVQHDDPRALPDFVDQMRGPKGGQAFVSTEPADMVEHELPAGDVEPDGRFVEQQKARLVQQSARDFDTAPLTTPNLSGANFSGADVSRALMRFADLTGANLSRANLMGADLSGADLTDADLTGADATEADLGGAVLKNVRGLETVKGLSPPKR